MPRRRSEAGDWLPLLPTGRAARELPTGEAFRPEWIDFERGIRVGNLEAHERVTQILKFLLERRYRTAFVTDRWGRGVYWQWICWLPKANRAAKPLSSSVNFGCAKLFISAERSERVFKAGLQVERGYAVAPSPYPGNVLQKDWDWHRLMAQCRAGSALEGELRRLLREGFVVEIGDWEANRRFDAASFRSAAELREVARRCRRDRWVGFQLYYPMPAAEIASCSGIEVIRAVEGIFVEVVPSMNLCMQVKLEATVREAPRERPSDAAGTADERIQGRRRGADI